MNDCRHCKKPIVGKSIATGVGPMHADCQAKVQRETLAIIEQAMRDGTHSNRPREFPPEDNYQRAGRLMKGFEYSERR